MSVEKAIEELYGIFGTDSESLGKNMELELIKFVEKNLVKDNLSK